MTHVISRTYPLEIITGTEEPLIRSDRTIAGQSGFGFEGGCAYLIDGNYHLFTSELIAEPLWSRTVLAHWSSGDGFSWQRVSSLRESTGDFSGLDRRAAYFSPMPIYDDDTDRWQLFYVSYRSAPGISNRNHDGMIWRAQSAVHGRAGIGGPYIDQDVAMRPDEHSQSWEGHQGTDSFYAYRGERGWIGLYGSCDVDQYPNCNWAVGVARADTLTGTWTREPRGNPVTAEPKFIENPVVVTLDDGTFLSVYENDALDPAFARSIGIMTSLDGISWTREEPLFLPDDLCPWASRVRTPLSFIPDGDAWRIYFTAFDDRGALPGSTSFGNVGMVRVRRTG
ncbi:glycoside hydrolase family protein [Microcella humidisoli]|uniref:Glycosyl hydrolase family 32 N-terminal domain-containing protein n=1 Tax=Microcella humidisoli TaxID=2963406 RepID=A0ABY5FZ62_9MICO|nr:hypothetical protein [Microcella humidisoli]UTT63616.1 hypothetical protein NNL39_05820 [Microcella humidisoli]